MELKEFSSSSSSSAGPEPLFVEVEAGSEIILDASDSSDPDDGDKLSFRWWQYRDVTATQWWVAAQVSDIEIQDVEHDDDKSQQRQPGSGRVVKARLPRAEKCAVDMFTGEPKEKGQVYHLILEVRDDGSPSLVSCKRVVVQSTNKRLNGRRTCSAESIAQVHAQNSE